MRVSLLEGLLPARVRCCVRIPKDKVFYITIKTTKKVTKNATKAKIDGKISQNDLTVFEK